MKPDARAINGEYGRGRRSLARARGRSPDRLKPLRDLYEGQSVRAHRFRYGLLAFDLVTVAFIVVTSFLPRGPVVETLDVGFSNRPFGVKRFQTIHQHSVDVAHGLVLLFGIGAKALPSWDSKTRRNNLWDGLAVSVTAGPSGHTISPHPSSREGHHSTAQWNSSFLLLD